MLGVTLVAVVLSLATSDNFADMGFEDDGYEELTECVEMINDTLACRACCLALVGSFQLFAMVSVSTL